MALSRIGSAKLFLKFFFSFVVSGVFIGAAFLFAPAGYASSPEDIVFPVTELGDCGSERECRAYCDDFSHIEACVAFAEKHNLMSAEEAAEARRFADAGISSGPGGCTSEDSCEIYCDNISHIEECIAFGESHGLISPDELSEAKLVAAALASGAALPGGCNSKDSCEAYCEDGAHIEECIAFAEAAGFMDHEELEEVRRILPLMQSGEMPGGCQNKRECEAYCNNDAHFGECLSFAEKAGFISTEEAEIARKTGGKGPGGCVRDECETYCDNSAHQEECFAFAKEHGLISDEEFREIEHGMEEFRRVLSDAPPVVIECLNDVLGTDLLADIRAGRGMPPRDSESGIRGCFEVFGSEMRDEGKHKIEEFLNSVPQPVADCVRERAGDVITLIEQGEFRGGESDIRPIMDACFREFTPEEGFILDFDSAETDGHSVPGGDVRTFINIDSIPPFARECVERKLQGDVDRRDIGHVIENCVREFLPNETMPVPHDIDSFERFERPEMIMHDNDGFEMNPPEFNGGFEPIDMPHDAVGGQFEGEFREPFQEEFQRQFEEQYQQQYEQEFQRQFEDIEGQYRSFDSFDGGTYTAPADAPQSVVPNGSLLGNVLTVVNYLLGY
ncbi:MAG: hypothetical protein COW88_00630 [Candidatus Lloydbacteria bacterium CG22_combo_CG10-13_8_21_14_all_47_15]|uniref:Uncharacterized protein n=1 Tax=Candidatus Lloydbacteria bacterium CG22_combo_CG10-13_8_21_14_all_47_15 TaxID=1974635 RepID=A0A2H0CVG2_9BACT|nr:MAG: hypothetical protein COW88_00630 [Candidatus Lloydbacteria bacterium CG22_combo_CG10-13_8_21_14_all_47_15]